MQAKRWLLTGLSLLMAFGCASCVPCDHPLSDAKSSVADEALVGDWVVKFDTDKHLTHVSIGRKHDAPNVMEWVASHVGEKDEIEIERHDFFTTKIGSLRLATYENDRDDDDERVGYSIWLLESPDKNTVVVSMIDEEILAKAIEAKHLRGEVSKYWFFGSHTAATRIDSSPEELRKYLSEVGEKCFLTKTPLMTLTRQQ